jgi:hypothetical protein
MGGKDVRFDLLSVKHSVNTLKCSDKAVNLFASIIYGKRSADGAFDAESFH